MATAGANALGAGRCVVEQAIGEPPKTVARVLAKIAFVQWLRNFDRPLDLAIVRQQSVAHYTEAELANVVQQSEAINAAISECLLAKGLVITTR
jgi:hypothetical protein